MQPLFMPRPALALAIALMPAAVLAQAEGLLERTARDIGRLWQAAQS